MKLFSITPVVEIKDVNPTITVTNNEMFSLCMGHNEGYEEKIEHDYTGVMISLNTHLFFFLFFLSMIRDYSKTNDHRIRKTIIHQTLESHNILMSQIR